MATQTRAERTVIDFLYLDLETCTRCRGTERSLDAALDAAREVLEATGSEVEVNRILVGSAEQARELRFESSPTIRIDGRDIALELRESSCGSEACTDGCGDSIACRVWVHEGQEHTEPPPAMVLDAILGAVYGNARVEAAGPPGPYELPANLRRFFADAADQPAEADEPEACCSSAEQSACCEPDEKAECCGAATGGSCGCR